MNFGTELRREARAATPAAIRDLRFRRDVDQLCRLGPRVVYEYLAEIGDARSVRTLLEDRAADYARIDQGHLAATRGDRFPQLPIHKVP